MVGSSNGISENRWSTISENATIHAVFENAVERYPNQIAVVCNEQNISYTELNRQANRLANYLRESGVTTGTPVAVSMEKSIDAVVAFLAVLKAGGIYLPVDADYPKDRIQYILNDAQASIHIIHQSKFTPKTTETIKTLIYEEVTKDVLPHAENNPDYQLHAADYSYIIYTSGTTGKPKGITLTHKTLVNLIQFQTTDRQCQENLRISQFASFSFDVSLQELCYTVANGYTLYVVPLSVRQSTPDYARYIVNHQITSIFITTSMLDLLAEAMLALEPSALALSEVFVSGETLKITKTIRDFFLRYPSVTLINQYGPSESHVMLSHTLSKDANEWEDFPPLGKSIPNFHTYVLNEQKRPTSENEIGELYISGVGLSQGYINRPELTSEKFSKNPFSHEKEYEILYQTGDLAKLLPDGNIQHMGRRDFQVKIRGFRIELQEIENVICEFEGIKQAVVLVKDRNLSTDALNTSSINMILVAYVVSDEKINTNQLLEFVKSKVPEYMVPGFFIQVADIPLTHNAKIDRKKLLSINEQKPTHQNLATTPLEKEIAKIWGKTLNLPVDVIDTQNNFFHFGGNSMLAIKLASEMSDIFQTHISISTLYENNCISALADHLQTTVPKIPEIERKIIVNEQEQLLSFAQERLWFIEKYEEGTSIYNIPIVYSIRPDVKMDLLELSLKKIVARHESLRTLIKEDNLGNSYQFVVDSDVLSMEKIWLNNSNELNEYLKIDTQHIFNLQQECPIRFKIYHVANQQRYILILFHHICTDGWSINLFINEFNSCYTFHDAMQATSPSAEPKLPDLKIQYKDFAIWQREYLRGDLLDKQLTFWVNKLNGLEALEFATDRRRPERIDYRGAAIGFELDIALSDSLRKLAKSLEVGLYGVLISAFFLTLRAFSNQKDIVIGMPVSNRHYRDTEKLIGFFANSLPLRKVIDDNTSISTYIQEIHQEIVQLQIHQDLPFEYLVEKLNITKDAGRHPVFQIMFGMQNFEDNLFGLASFDEQHNPNALLQVYKQYVPLYDSAKFDLTVFVNDSGKKLSGVFNYATALFNEDSVTSYVQTFKQLLIEISKFKSSGPGSLSEHKLADITYLDSVNYQKVTANWNRDCVSSDFYQTLDSLFAQQVQSNGDKVALVYKEVTLTYQQLDAKSNQLANHLQQHYQIKPNDFIGLFIQPSEQVCIAILAILKLGAAYVPIDLRNPEDRIAYILSDTQCPLVIVDEKSKDKLQFIGNEVTLLPIDSPRLQKTLSQSPRETPIAKHDANDLAYIIYTSGTTGKPKGVMVPHKSVAAFCLADNYCSLNEKNTVLGYSSYAFDGSVFDIFTSLTRGAKLIAIGTEVLLDDKELGNVIKTHHVDTMFITSALFINYADLKQNNPLLSLSNILFGGEKVSPEKIKNFFDYNQKTRLIHVYGPTECIVFSTFCDLTSANLDAMPIGGSLSDKKIYVLDEHLRVLPVGAIGELYISGLSLAQGYLHQEKLTQSKFIPNRFQTSSEKEQGLHDKLYKTGDLVRFLTNGDIQYIARNDAQVKIRGYRIELTDIEEIINSYPTIEKVVVIAKGSSEKKYLITYLQTNPQNSDATQADHAEYSKILDFAKQKLPEYMLPSEFAFVDKIPVNTNGKIDKTALQQIPTQMLSTSGEFISPTSHYEILISNVWKNILNRELISTNDNFFDIGGNSILLTQMHSSLPEEIKKRIKIIDLFKYPTISMISHFLTQGYEMTNTPLKNETNHQNPHFENNKNSNENNDIAVIGMAGRFPGADNIEDFWKNLTNGKESITFYTNDDLKQEGIDQNLLDNPYYVKAQSTLSDVCSFDADFFAYSPNEAKLMDPQQRIFLECAYHALENSGYDNEESHHATIGLYAGIGRNKYLSDHIHEPGLEDPVGQYQTLIGNGADFLCTRVAYKLNLQGPALTIQTACSSSLVAIHQACIALNAEDCDIAMAGGVSFQGLDKQGYLYEPDMIGSPDGRCRAFDADANGTIGGQGVGLVVLKKLSTAQKDGDNILAVIKGHAINNDGNNKIGFTAPSTQGQAEVIRKAHERAGVSPDSITYIEAHGTGTKLGDPIEIDALKTAFASNVDSTQTCAIGSVKPNIGHLDAASGVTGFIKAVLCLQHHRLVPTLHYKKNNEKIDFSGTPFYIISENIPWNPTSIPRRAGVSSFGLGGTNAHFVLEEYHRDKQRNSTSKNVTDYPIFLSAHTQNSLRKKHDQLLTYLKDNNHIALSDVSYTLLIKRKQFQNSLYTVANSIQDIVDKLENNTLTPCNEDNAVGDIIFMFPGQGSQYAGMGQQLYQRHEYFRHTMDECFSIIKQHSLDFSVRDIFSSSKKLHQTLITQPALFVMEYAMAKYLMHMGVRPSAMIGHSVGEYVAACLAGVLSLQDALFIVIQRAKLVQTLPSGAMLSVLLPNAEAHWCQLFDVDIAAINDNHSFVASGSPENIAKLSDYLTKNDISHKAVTVSHAFHSRMLDPILPSFANALRQITFSTPKIPLISNVSGTFHTETSVTSKQYWIDHLRGTVQFAKGLTCLLDNTSFLNTTFIEVGPSQVLTKIGKRLPQKPTHFIPSMASQRNHEREESILLSTLLYLHAGKCLVNWSYFFAGESRFIDLPTYPFDKKEYWIPQKDHGHNKRKINSKTEIIIAEEASTERESCIGDEVTTTLLSLLKEYLGHTEIHQEDDFFELGGDSLLAIRLINRINTIFKCNLELSDIFSKPTISKLAQHINQVIITRKSSATEDWSAILVKLHDAPASQNTVFLVHAIDGYLKTYGNFINALKGDYNIYGLQNPYLEKYNPSISDLDSIEKIADYYIKAVESITTEAPYTIVGFSLGGIISFEMSRKLIEQGKQVNLLGMIDCIRPDHPYANLQNTVSVFLDIVRIFAKGDLEITNDEFSQLERFQKIDLLVNAIGFDDLSVDRREQIYTQIINYSEAIASYQAKPYSGKVLFFNAKERFPNYQDITLDETWREVMAEEMIVHEVPGNHFSMLDQNHVMEITNFFEAHTVL